MKIESIIRRKTGTKVQLDGIEYHFNPGRGSDSKAHVCEVTDRQHIQTFLRIPEGYRLPGDEEAPEGLLDEEEPGLTIVPDSGAGKEDDTGDDELTEDEIEALRIAEEEARVAAGGADEEEDAEEDENPDATPAIDAAAAAAPAVVPAGPDDIPTDEKPKAAAPAAKATPAKPKSTPRSNRGSKNTKS